MALTYVIPDLHGRHDLLLKALQVIEQRQPNGGHKVIFLGDYIDRGPQSAEVVATLRRGLEQNKPWITLKGNHEDFMACVIVRSDHMLQDSWMANGGRETVNSYGKNVAVMTHDAKWMDLLPAYHEDQHRVYVHAFAPEDRPLHETREHVFLWTRYPKGADIGYRGKHVVHGHTPMHEPELLVNRTNLDCGAVFTGRLIVGVFDDDRPGGPANTFSVYGEKG